MMSAMTIIAVGSHLMKMDYSHYYVIDGPDSKENTYAGRCYFDSPEIDSNIWIHSAVPLETGSFVQVRVTGTEEYDLLGEYVDEPAQ